MLKTVAFIPIKKTSKRVRSKNFREFAGLPLYQWFLRKLEGHDLGLDEIYVDTDSDEIAAYAQDHGFRYLPREPRLAADSANGNDLLLHAAETIPADIYVQLFITAPLLRHQTIREAVRIMREEDCDSCFTAVEHYSWFWFDGRPVNYDPKVLPRSQDARPIVQETTGLYAITRAALLNNRCRIGSHPHLLLVDEFEAIDIDTELQFRLAEFLYGLLQPDSPAGH